MPTGNCHFEVRLLSFNRGETKTLVFGHTGITLGAATLLVRTLGLSIQHNPTSWLTYLGSRIDIRLLLVGSLLPDIIDKPLGQLFFPEALSNGRIFCHTLLFLILLSIAGIFLYKRHLKTNLLILSFGTLTHLIFDQMWLAPHTLFWPLLGLAFEKIDLSNFIQNIFLALLTDPSVFIPELVGASILIWLAVLLFHRRGVFAFIKHGQIR